MTERVRAQQTQQRAAEVVQQTTPATSGVDYAAVLDEIDQVLETDAADYVRSFVQKGGQ